MSFPNSLHSDQYEPKDDQHRRQDARHAQRLLEHEDCNDGTEENASLSQAGNDGDRRKRHGPEYDAVG